MSTYSWAEGDWNQNRAANYTDWGGSVEYPGSVLEDELWTPTLLPENVEAFDVLAAAFYLRHDGQVVSIKKAGAAPSASRWPLRGILR